MGIAKGPGRGGKSGQMADEQPFGDDHAKAALKIQTRARVRSDATRVEKLKAEAEYAAAMADKSRACARDGRTLEALQAARSAP